MGDGSNLQQAWDRVSAAYQARHAHSTHSVSYGAWSPPESELQLLGDVGGLRILDLGCGGGQSAIALTRLGATVVGVDSSAAQIAFARNLAAAEGVRVEFTVADAEDLSGFERGAWDIILSAHALTYVAEIQRCLAECNRLLKPGGRLAFSVDHPFRNLFFDGEDHELTLYPSRDYLDTAPMHWTFADTGVAMQSTSHTIGDWVQWLGDAGFVVRRLTEPPAPLEMLDEIWPKDSALAPLRHLPQTLIILAEKTP
jgi:SAM-dependent methyltransferase